MKQRFYTSIILIFLTLTSYGQQTKNYKSEAKLEEYYPLDSIKSVEIENKKGRHHLSKNQILSLIRDLRTYTYGGNYASTKPGYFWCKIIFQNGSDLYFYNNSNSEIIISNGFVDDHTFKTKKKVNFENY